MWDGQLNIKFLKKQYKILASQLKKAKDLIDITK